MTKTDFSDRKIIFFVKKKDMHLGFAAECEIDLLKEDLVSTNDVKEIKNEKDV